MLNNLIILRHTMDAYKDRLRAVELVTYAELCALKTRQEKMKQFVPWVQYLAFDGENTMLQTTVSENLRPKRLIHFTQPCNGSLHRKEAHE